MRFANKYFDNKQPWKAITENKTECDNTIYHCLLMISNLAQLLSPFLPFSSKEVNYWVGNEDLKWAYKGTIPSKLAGEVTPLFERIDVSNIEKELDSLYTKAVL